MSNPVRTCLGCRQRAGKVELVRLVSRDGIAWPDPDQVEPGRGAYLHPAIDCLEQALRRRSLGRALRTEIDGQRTGDALRTRFASLA